MKIEAFAKINLFLSVTGRRPDGYHEIDTVMQRIGLADTVTLKKATQGIAFTCDDPSLPTDEKNLCVKAAKAYFAAAKTKGSVSIALEKRIPAGAGLGGGSADAAAVLRGLAALFPAGIDLAAVALSVGADVPFCLEGRTARCRGLGEVITPLDFPGREGVFALVAKGKAALSTAAVYARRDEAPFSEKSAAETMTALVNGDLSAIRAALFNDLEDAAASLLPEIRALSSIMAAYGAKDPLMTGSGAAVFSLFESREKAEVVASLLRQDGFFAAVAPLL